MIRRVFLFTIAACAVTAAGSVAIIEVAEQPNSPQKLRKFLAAALAKQDATAIRKAVVDVNRQLGKNAGVPETPDKYLPIPKDGIWLTDKEAIQGFEPFFLRLEQLRWWKIGIDPTKLGHPLREAGDILSGNLAACRANLKGAERSLAFAKEAADFLLWTQERAGTGVFPFPASRGVSQSAPFMAAEKQFIQAEKDGRLNSVIKNGWAINDDGDGGLQFDNAECGVAIFEIYEYTKEKKYLEAAKKSADWAMRRPLVTNWNYNSFSVHLLARAYRVTGDKKYLTAATNKASLGVIPGQLVEGQYVGRWNDPHNARPNYHYIMLRSLAELLTVLPKNAEARPMVLKSLQLGLKARNQDFRTQGAPNKDNAMEALLIVNRAFADDKKFLTETLSSDALDSLAKLVSEQSRQGRPPLGPKAWGHFLEYVVSKGGLN